MPQIVLDALSHQAIRHAGTEGSAYGAPPDQAGAWRDERLRGVIAALTDAGHQLVIARPEPLALAEASILMIASRSQVLPFNVDELRAIRAFVAGGGGLWLMANHRLFVAPQQQVVEALTLPLRLNDITVANYPKLRLLPHAVGEGCASLVIRNASSISPAAGAETVVSYAADERHAFAVAVEPSGERKGRVLVTADSGFVASRDDTGQRMLEQGSNARFFANGIGWLLRDR